MELLQHSQHLAAGVAVQRAGGLVGQNDRRIPGQRPGNGDALLLTAGKLAGLVFQLIAQPHLLQCLAGPAAALGAGHARIDQRHLHVFQQIQFGQQVILLEDEAQHLVAHLSLLIAGHVAHLPAIEPVAARCGHIQAAGMNVRVVLLPEPEDPDSFARAHTAAEVQEYIKANEVDFITFKAQLLMKDAQNDPIKRAALIGDMVQSITQIPDSIQRSVYVKECARLMDIDERVLVEEVARKRVVQTGGGREASDFIRRQQMRQRSEEQAAVPEPQVDFTKGVAAGSATQELEKELLKYLLKYGHRNFDFKEGRDVIQMNVADVILSTLDAQELHFQTEVYRKMLDTYREQRAELGEGVEVPAHLFINHPDPAVCNAAVDILTSDDNYVPSKLWKQKEVHVESVEEILAQGVPKAVILYKSNAIKKLIDEQMQRLASGQLTEEEELEATTLINTLNCEKTNISHKVQRTIL